MNTSAYYGAKEVVDPALDAQFNKIVDNHLNKHFLYIDPDRVSGEFKAWVKNNPSFRSLKDLPGSFMMCPSKVSGIKPKAKVWLLGLSFMKKSYELALVEVNQHLNTNYSWDEFISMGDSKFESLNIRGAL